MAKLGAVDGASALLRGMGFAFGTPGVRGLAFVPAAIAAGVFLVTGTLGGWAAASLGPRLGGEGVFGALLAIALVLAALLVAFVVATALAQPLSSFALDRIVRAQEQALGVPPPATDPGSSFFRSLRVTLAALLVGLPLIGGLTLLGVLVPPAVVVTVPLKLSVAAGLLAWDFLDYPLAMRGLGVRQRAAWMQANAGAVLGFGAATAALLLLPGIGLLVLPGAVAGATRLVAASTEEPMRRPSQIPLS